ncbi:Nitrilase family, member 2 [Seminavis robusta]|uniref:Nitrilase family, member 2 n=1 Tax=Seminavis robusta TaxID=568900 RepID=A0A9N8HBR9_9STRA|nr:Nitrilase family, member 2 [Seminavis robusta]|eukprot:Sro270_g104340.1 Nitrilase family, member 2 (375) ;mRNA; r:68232-69557
MNLYAILQEMNNFNSRSGETTDNGTGNDGLGADGNDFAPLRRHDGGYRYDNYPPLDRLGFPSRNFQADPHHQLLQQPDAVSMQGGLLPVRSGSTTGGPFRSLSSWVSSSSDLQPRPFAPDSSFGGAPAPASNELYSNTMLGGPLAPPTTNAAALSQLLGGGDFERPRKATPYQSSSQYPLGMLTMGTTKPSAYDSSAIMAKANSVVANNPRGPVPVPDGPLEGLPGQHLVKGMFGSKKAKVLLPVDFHPSEYTVILGRGRCTESIGNKRFKAIVQNHLQEYLEAPGKLEKTFIVTKVMNIVRESSPMGAFVKYENGRWWNAGERAAREKVGASFRDALHNYYKSSSKSKVARRRAKEQEWSSGGAAHGSHSSQC